MSLLVQSLIVILNIALCCWDGDKLDIVIPVELLIVTYEESVVITAFRFEISACPEFSTFTTKSKVSPTSNLPFPFPNVASL